ncbi:MAG: molecular chaperone DnaJ [Candidatus Diapherotrites archaeon]|uniref:Molecular chaperone DnaJ n=1 Tax=Candidatus Iainarchaeum sp. TaxID=3101447 RepID=A0A8T3YJN7_9ARCH|nr:molecular chaperone DnaJ [Candidatus Diapherotrites archaeon]
MAKDYYETLGIQRNASQEEITRAYKELAKKYHPDISKERGAEEKFKEVQHAYSVLGDGQKRRNYDQFGSEAERFSGFSGFNAGGFSNTEADFSDIFESFGFGRGFSDIFGAEFGGGRAGPRRGENMAVRLNLTFEEAAFGTKKEIELERIEECGNCHGSGARPGTSIETCRVCGGSGMERSTRRTFLGVIQTQSTCRKCRGSGETVSDPCPECSGKGNVHRRKKITISVPEGIDTGQQLRLKGQGNYGEKGAGRGDLIAIVYVEPHEIFRRDGTDIFMEAPLSFSEAALGAAIEVPTLKGKAKLRIPAGTQGGTIFKMTGKGVKAVDRNAYGDEYVKVLVRTPEKPSKRERELLEKLAEEEEVSRKRNSFFDRFKGMFG